MPGVYARPRVHRFRRATAEVEASRHVKVALTVNRHPVPAPTRVKVVEDSHVGYCPIRLEIIRSNHPRSAFGNVGLDEVESLVVGRNHNAVRALDFRLSQYLCNRSIWVDSVDCVNTLFVWSWVHPGAVGEIDSILRVDCEIVRPIEPLSLVALS